MLASGTTIAAIDADIHLIDPFLNEDKASQLFAELYNSIPWQQDRIRLYGREIAVPRLQAWYGDTGCDYSYSGIQLQPLEWIPVLRAIKQSVEEVLGTGFNSVLINLYRNGQDSNGWHADNEPELGNNPVIASLSLGATRRFKLRHNTVKGLLIDIELNHGSLLIMSGSTQSFWKHCVPKTSRKILPRINLTFRKIINQ